jgi:hypothetical protein
MRPLLVVALLSLPAVAAPRDFPFTWTSRTAPAGQSSFEAWLTPRLVRTDDFLQLDTRVVWTHGVSRTLETQLSMDLDFQRTNFTQGLDPKLTSLWRWTTWREGTPFAVGGLGRVSLGLDLFEAEARLFADWKLARVVLALNASASRALFWNGREGVDTRLEESFGAKYLVSPAVAFGLELRAKSSWKQREYQGTAIYVGPALTFTHEKFWVTLGGFTQVAADKANADRPLAQPDELRDNERFVLRLVVGANTP